MSEAPREWYSEEVKRLLGEIERLYAESDISDGLLADAKADNERLRAACQAVADTCHGAGAKHWAACEQARRAPEPKS